MLYCIYMEELLNTLKYAGFGCWIGDTYLGAVSYVDDLSLLNPSIHGMQQILNI